MQSIKLHQVNICDNVLRFHLRIYFTFGRYSFTHA